MKTNFPSTDCIPVQELEERIDELNKHRKKRLLYIVEVVIDPVTP